MIRVFKGTGKVQGVMFRQTLIRAAQKRGLSGGAANLVNSKSVQFYLSGEEELINEIISFLKSGKELNDWGACIEDLVELEEKVVAENYEVTTENVDDFEWSPNVTMYL